MINVIERNPTQTQVYSEPSASLWVDKKLSREPFAWNGTFDEYLNIALSNPSVAMLAHERVYHALGAMGVRPHDGGPQENLLSQIVDRLSQAAQRLEVRKRIFLLVGDEENTEPVAETLKRALEAYTKRSENAVYAIKDCPTHEEPLHLIPHKLREEIEQKYSLHIEGDLCAHCKNTLGTMHEGNVLEVPVERIALSRTKGIGIGEIDLRKEEHQDGRRIIQAIYAGNRGIVDFKGFLSAEVALLYPLLTLSQEQALKTPRGGLMDMDVALVAHATEAEYQHFRETNADVGLADRIVTVREGV